MTRRKTAIPTVLAIAFVMQMIPWESLAANCPAGDKGCQELQSQLNLNTDLVFFYNPLGFIGIVGLNYKKPYAYSEKFDTVWAHLKGGAQIVASPATARLNVHLEWMPVAFFKIRALYSFLFFYGVFGSVLSYDSTDVPFDESDVYDRKGEEERTFGQRWSLRPTVQAQWKFLAFVSHTEFSWTRINAEGPYIFFWRYETLVEPEDFIIDSSTSLYFELYKGKKNAQLLLGPSYVIMYPKGSGLRRQQLGISGYFAPWDHTEHLGEPRFFASLLYNLEEPNRQNELFFLAGIGTTWNLF